VKAILVRVGIDQAYGNWNAPVEPNYGRFAYTPIPESKQQHHKCQTSYNQLLPHLREFAAEYYLDLSNDLRFPKDIEDQPTHLDPDFEHLTYGDDGDARGSQIRKMSNGDLVVFYAGLRPFAQPKSQLIYALIGLFKIDEVVRASDVPEKLWNQNAHTRRKPCDDSDIIVRALPGYSGRLVRCLPIGEFRNRAYRVSNKILNAWGGLTVKDGFIQRSARPPLFLNPNKFYRWFQQQNVPLIQSNNLESKKRVILVHLRQPNRSDPEEKRSDPFWEFGSFGCTGCHRHNLMHLKHAEALDGVRLGFAQGGNAGFKMVLLTPPITVVKHKNRCEVRWERTQEMPFRYSCGPLLIDNKGRTDFPSVKRMLRSVNRSTWMGKFSSKFRSMSTPLPASAAETVIKKYSRLLGGACQKDFAETYDEVLPYAPRTVDNCRKRTYNQLLKAVERRVCRPKCRRTRSRQPKLYN